MRYCILFATVFFLSGCAAKPVAYLSNPNLSHANNILHAAGIDTLHDVKIEQAQEGKTETVRDNSPSLLGAASFGTLSAMTTPLGAGSLLEGGLGAVAWLSTGKVDKGALYPRFFAWMPKEWASSAAEAKVKMKKLLVNAAREALKTVQLPEGYSVSPTLEKFGGVGIEGEQCQQGSLYCGYRFSVSTPNEGVAPDFLGGYDAWVWDVQGRRPAVTIYQSYHNTKTHRWEARFPDLKVFIQMTEVLPEWVFGYMSPAKNIVSTCGEQDCEFLKYPLVLDQGKTLYLIKPQPSTVKKALL